MPSVIDRAVRTLRAHDGVVFDVSEHTITVPAASGDGFAVRLHVVHDREFVVSYDRWQHTFDRAEDAFDCFEYGMWMSGHHRVKRFSLAFWRPMRTVYRQNHVFRRSTC